MPSIFDIFGLHIVYENAKYKNKGWIQISKAGGRFPCSCLTLKKEFNIATGFKFQSLPKDGYTTKALNHPDNTHQCKEC